MGKLSLGEKVTVMTPDELTPWQKAVLQSVQDFYSDDGKVVMMGLCRPPASPRNGTVFNMATGQELQVPTSKPRPELKMWVDESQTFNMPPVAELLAIGIDLGSPNGDFTAFFPKPEKEDGGA